MVERFETEGSTIRDITDDFIDDYQISMETRQSKHDAQTSMDVYYSITPYNPKTN